MNIANNYKDDTDGDNGDATQTGVHHRWAYLSYR